jgi:hypothetical protein
MVAGAVAQKKLHPRVQKLAGAVAQKKLHPRVKEEPHVA